MLDVLVKFLFKRLYTLSDIEFNAKKSKARTKKVKTIETQLIGMITDWKQLLNIHNKLIESITLNIKEKVQNAYNVM